MLNQIKTIETELNSQGPPFCFFVPQIGVQVLAALLDNPEVETIKAEAPGLKTEGCLLAYPSSWDSDFLGFKCLKLAGPWVPRGEFGLRAELSLALAQKSLAWAKEREGRMLTAKLPADPALIQGFNQAGFLTAETVTCLRRAITREIPLNDKSFSGFEIISRNFEPEKAARDLGDFFYDGHHRFDANINLNQACALWQKVVVEQLSGQADWAFILQNIRNKETAALVTAPKNEAGADLFIIAVAEKYRKQGLGKLALSLLLNRLAQDGVSFLNVQTASFNLPALKLYQSFNFEITPPLVTMHAWV